MIRIIIFLLTLILSLLNGPLGYAFWVWTPETNKWVNPKYSVKETPQEQLQYAVDFYQAKEYEEAIREFNKLLKHYPKAREAPQAQFYIAKCYEDQEKLYHAFKNYQTVIDQYPFSNLAPEVVRIQYEIGLKMLDGEGGRRKIIETIVGGEHNVIEVFQAVIKNAPYSQYAAPAQYKIGLYLLEKQLYQEARDELDKVINDYPDSEWAKAATYQIAITDATRSASAQYEQTITQAAVEEFKDFVENNPDAELSDQAKAQIRQLREKEAENTFLVAQFYEKQKNYKAAKIYYQSVVNDYDNSSWSAKSLERIQELNRLKQ